MNYDEANAFHGPHKTYLMANDPAVTNSALDTESLLDQAKALDLARASKVKSLLAEREALEAHVVKRREEISGELRLLGHKRARVAQPAASGTTVDPNGPFGGH